jgi:hypothetical protein
MIFNIGCAQRMLKVTSCASGESLPYATVLVNGQARLTNLNGYIELNSSDTVEIRYVGYTVRRVSPEEREVCLEEKTLQFATVVIESRVATKPVKLGYPRKGVPDFHFSTGIGNALMVHIPNPNSRELDVITAAFTLQNYDSLPGIQQTYATYQVLLYSVHPDSLAPHEPIVPELYIRSQLKGVRTVTVDLGNYQIRIPKHGLFLGLKATTITGGHYDRRSGKPFDLSKLGKGDKIPQYVSKWGTWISGSIKAPLAQSVFLSEKILEKKLTYVARKRRRVFFSITVNQ